MTHMATAQSAYPRKNPLLSLSKIFNKPVLLFAGTRLLPLYGVLAHRGRRSGKLFRTPVVVRPTPDGFVIPMPWGETTDWCRNIRAAGGCQVRWKGRDYTLVEPRVIDATSAETTFNQFQSRMMRRLKIHQALHLRRA
jgi:deazaflavin-dependent oxidoreductase (nitroreductase family)